MPFLQSLLPVNRSFYICVLFEIYETMNSIFLCKAGHDFSAMFIHSLDQIARHANVKRAAQFTGEDVNPICPFPAHDLTSALRIGDYWVPRLRGA